MFLTFWGKPRWAESEHIQHALHGDDPDPTPRKEHGGHMSHHVPDPRMPAEGTGGYHPHESPWTMLVPLGLLALGAVFRRVRVPPRLHRRSEFWNGSIAYNEHLDPRDARSAAVGEADRDRGHADRLRSPGTPTSATRGDPGEVAEQLGPVYRFVYNKWYFDELYDFLFVKPAFWLGRLFWQKGDEGTIDRFGPTAPPGWSGLGGGSPRLQSGYLTSYALSCCSASSARHLGLVGDGAASRSCRS
jgi:NADH-quinone oxidoreductase subunit L